MISFPNAKINIGLHVLKKRGDGYHDIATVFYPVPWCDVLEVIPSGDNNDQAVFFQQTGLLLPGEREENTCVKAYRLLQKERQFPGVKMHLHKIIPTGAGLGGGSSDAAFSLKLLNQLFNLKLEKEVLFSAAKSLGADCSFFLDNQPAFATGRGDELQALALDLTGYYILIVYPGIHVSTADAYGGVVPQSEEISLMEAVKLPPEQWKGKIINRFENSVFHKYPLIRDIKEQLYQKGAVYASMSGSGSAVYGIFTEKPDAGGFEQYVNWCGKITSGLS